MNLVVKVWQTNINNKVLLYSTGNYVQCPVINHNGKECKKKNVYVCITESFAVQQRLAHHCKSTILKKKKVWQTKKEYLVKGD